MRSFKAIFYPIYLIVALTAIYFGFDFLIGPGNDKESITQEGFSFYENVYVSISFIVLGCLMLVEIISENLQIGKLKNKFKKAEEEALKYKARLFDLSEKSDKPLPPAESEEGQEG